MEDTAYFKLTTNDKYIYIKGIDFILKDKNKSFNENLSFR